MVLLLSAMIFNDWSLCLQCVFEGVTHQCYKLVIEGKTLDASFSVRKTKGRLR